MGAGGDRKTRAGRTRDRDGNIGRAGEDGGRKAEGDNVMGDGRITEAGSCRDAAKNGRDTESTGDAAENGRDTESTGDGRRRSRRRSRDGHGTKCPKEMENGR